MIKLINKNDYVVIKNICDYEVSKDNPFINVYGYYTSDKLIGFIDYSIIYNKAEINYIYVIKKYRKQKIGSMLMEHFINNLDVKEVTLEVNINNIEAIKLYEKYGFKVVAKREKYYNDVDAYLMRLKVYGK